MKKIACLLLSASSLLRAAAAECFVTPTGIGSGPNDIPASKIDEIVAKLGPGIPFPFLFIPLTPAFDDVIIVNYETPIQFRLGAQHGMSIYNVMAMYQPDALDVWGRGHRRLCLDQLSEEDAFAHEIIANIYAFAYGTLSLMPETKENVASIMENVYDLPMSVLDGSEPASTPWGLAKTYFDEMIEYQKTDGWNSDGSLSNNFNKMPYSDFAFTDADGNSYTPYQPTPNEISPDWFKRDRCRTGPKPWKWEPLLEDNGFGFFSKQEHVTPYIGFTGRLFGITEEEFEAFSSPIPDYDWCEEADFVLEQTRTLATSDAEKMQVELFDSKFTSLLPLQIRWGIQSGLSVFDFWTYDMGLVVGLLDATTLVWRDKVIFDLVRPTTVVHAVKADEEVTSYGGQAEGVQTMDGGDWQPYIRTMPHAEYPSGSSCVCTFYAELLQDFSGSDETGIPLTQFIPAGSSKLEPGVTPAKDLTLVFNKWSEVQAACGASRENGGMHFSQAVPAGEQLCSGVGSLIVDKIRLLVAGNPEGALADFDDRTIKVRSKSY